MALINDEIRGYIGMETELKECCDPVEKGAVRRFAQAIMDLDPIYADPEVAKKTRYKEPVAPPLFPAAMLRQSFDEPDLVSERAEDPNFDGIVGSSSLGLPPLPLVNKALINGGTDVELFRFARHGERVFVKSRYKDIYERETSKGPMLFILYESDFLDEKGDLIIRFRKTTIRR
jgi:acyl dehydratase